MYGRQLRTPAHSFSHMQANDISHKQAFPVDKIRFISLASDQGLHIKTNERINQYK
jgi:hypothetical protein